MFHADRHLSEQVINTYITKASNDGAAPITNVILYP